MGLAPDEAVHPMSRDEYFRWCDDQPVGRYERIDSVVVKMAAERGGPIRMKAAVFSALRQAVADAGVGCQALPDGAAVATGDSDYEPDAAVNCGEPMGDEEVLVPNPVIVVDVLSPGTRSVDTGGKLLGYFRVPSIHHYLIVHPIRRAVIHHRREGDRIETQFIGNGPVTMEPPGITITIEELHEPA